jgi:hypothetical protein
VSTWGKFERKCKRFLVKFNCAAVDFDFSQVALLSNKVNVALAGAEAKNSYIWSVVKHKTGNGEDNWSAI